MELAIKIYRDFDFLESYISIIYAISAVLRLFVERSFFWILEQM